ncbi:AraC family transcriptional regulator [uncultured Pseudoteredinibacter sp.]|uniref:AraC family transcriptional regulator n=1 Tax=uncultured Pseudoteredinibacter sp. TaxID=1641701 RepID=UPI00261F9F08|nr:AraC family transcriptional regulator [uncultured Pseudoteredinibacter sp.]
MLNVTRPLNRHPLFKSHNIDEAHELVAKHVKPHSIQIAGKESALNVQFDGLNLGDISLFHVYYGAAVRVNPHSESESFFIQYTLSGDGKVQHQGKEINTQSSDTVVVSPSLQYQMQLEEQCSRIAIEINKQALEKQLSMALGAEIEQPLEFEFHQQDNQGSWKNTINYALQQIELAPQLIESKAGKKALSDLLIAQLLQTQRHNYQQALQQPGDIMMPTHLRKAVDFIQDNISNPPSMIELAAYCNTSVRTLQRSFSRCLNDTPLAYIRKQRLSAIHSVLLATKDKEAGQLTRILLDYGITDFGRFAHYYRQRYGCKPSDTLKK